MRAYRVTLKQDGGYAATSYIVVASGAREAAAKGWRHYRAEYTPTRGFPARVASVEEIDGTVVK